MPDHLAHRPSATPHDDGPRAVLRLRHSPEKVFRAISDPDELRHWYPALVETDHDRLAAAWRAHLERLFALVQGQRADQPEGHLRALRERYAAEV